MYSSATTKSKFQQSIIFTSTNRKEDATPWLFYLLKMEGSYDYLIVLPTSIGRKLQLPLFSPSYLPQNFYQYELEGSCNSLYLTLLASLIRKCLCIKTEICNYLICDLWIYNIWLLEFIWFAYWPSIVCVTIVYDMWQCLLQYFSDFQSSNIFNSATLYHFCDSMTCVIQCVYFLHIMI